MNTEQRKDLAFRIEKILTGPAGKSGKISAIAAKMLAQNAEPNPAEAARALREIAESLGWDLVDESGREFLIRVDSGEKPAAPAKETKAPPAPAKAPPAPAKAPPATSTPAAPSEAHVPADAEITVIKGRFYVMDASGDRVKAADGRNVWDSAEDLAASWPPPKPARHPAIEAADPELVTAYDAIAEACADEAIDPERTKALIKGATGIKRLSAVFLDSLRTLAEAVAADTDAWTLAPDGAAVPAGVTYAPPAPEVQAEQAPPKPAAKPENGDRQVSGVAVLCVGCIPRGGDIVVGLADDLGREAQDRVASDAGVTHPKEIEFGKGIGRMEAHLIAKFATNPPAPVWWYVDADAYHTPAVVAAFRRAGAIVVR